MEDRKVKGENKLVGMRVCSRMKYGTEVSPEVLVVYTRRFEGVEESGSGGGGGRRI